MQHFMDMTCGKEYSKQQNLPFKKDGVIEVALDKKGIKVLENISNGQNKTD